MTYNASFPGLHVCTDTFTLCIFMLCYLLHMYTPDTTQAFYLSFRSCTFHNISNENDSLIPLFHRGGGWPDIRVTRWNWRFLHPAFVPGGNGGVFLEAGKGRRQRFHQLNLLIQHAQCLGRVGGRGRGRGREGAEQTGQSF